MCNFTKFTFYTCENGPFFMIVLLIKLDFLCSAITDQILLAAISISHLNLSYLNLSFICIPEEQTKKTPQYFAVDLFLFCVTELITAKSTSFQYIQ